MLATRSPGKTNRQPVAGTARFCNRWVFGVRSRTTPAAHLDCQDGPELAFGARCSFSNRDTTLRKNRSTLPEGGDWRDPDTLSPGKIERSLTVRVTLRNSRRTKPSASKKAVRPKSPLDVTHNRQDFDCNRAQRAYYSHVNRQKTMKTDQPTNRINEVRAEISEIERDIANLDPCESRLERNRINELESEIAELVENLDTPEWAEHPYYAEHPQHGRISDATEPWEYWHSYLTRNGRIVAQFEANTSKNGGWPHAESEQEMRDALQFVIDACNEKAEREAAKVKLASASDLMAKFDQTISQVKAWVEGPSA